MGGSSIGFSVRVIVWFVLAYCLVNQCYVISRGLPQNPERAAKERGGVLVMDRQTD